MCPRSRSCRAASGRARPASVRGLGERVFGGAVFGGEAGRNALQLRFTQRPCFLTVT